MNIINRDTIEWISLLGSNDRAGVTANELAREMSRGSIEPVAVSRIFEDPNDKVRCEAAWALAEQTTELAKFSGALNKGLLDRHSLVRYWCVRSLMNSSCELSLSLLLALHTFFDSDPRVRLAIVDVLLSLDEETLRLALLSDPRLVSSDQLVRERITFVHNILSQGSLGTVEMSESQSGQLAHVVMITRLHRRAISQLLNSPEATDQTIGASVLGMVVASMWRDNLELFSSNTPDVQLVAVRSIRRQLKEASLSIESNLHTGYANSELRSSILDALGTIRMRRKSLLAIVKDVMDENSETASTAIELAKQVSDDILQLARTFSNSVEVLTSVLERSTLSDDDTQKIKDILSRFTKQ